MQRALTVQINIPSTVTGKEEESDHEDGEPDVSIDASNSINALGVPACKELTRPNHTSKKRKKWRGLFVSPKKLAEKVHKSRRQDFATKGH